jgi:GDP-mannose 6-dehydrogenase
LARDGHEVVGVDVNPLKVEAIRDGTTPVVEPGLSDLISNATRTGRLQAIDDAEQAVGKTEVSLICVGTPSNGNGSLKLDYVENVCRQIGEALATKTAYHVVVIRSTVLPGTLEQRLLPVLEESSGKKAGVDFGLAMNPEFLRESSAIRDYDNPSLIVIGQIDTRTGDAVERMYETISAPVVRTTIKTAEMVKYVNNAFHALKVTFANEMGNLCKAHGVDGREVMDIFCQDRQLNISPTYFKPGFAFGGSCLPKDTRALAYRAKLCDLETPLLEAILKSNQHQILRGIEMVERTGRKRIGVLGLSFKAGTDDVRESPVIPLVETLVGRGYEVIVYDEHLELSKLTGANKEFLDREIPHIASLLCRNVSDVLAHAEVVVMTYNSEKFSKVPQQLRQNQILIDLGGISVDPETMHAGYDGICWPGRTGASASSDPPELPLNLLSDSIELSQM